MMQKVIKILEYVSILLLILLTGVVTLQIVARIFSYSIAWTGELSIYSYIALSFLGGAFAYHKGESFRITFLIDKLPPRFKKIVDLAVLVISLLVVLVIVYTSIKYMINTWGTPTTALRWNKALIFIVIPVGYLLILIRLGKDFMKLIVTSD